jgi:hypothetical protein
MDSKIKEQMDALHAQIATVESAQDMALAVGDIAGAETAQATIERLEANIENLLMKSWRYPAIVEPTAVAAAR